MNPSFNSELEFLADYEKTPLLDRYPFTNTYELLKQAKASFATDRALVQLLTAEIGEQPDSINYIQLFERATQVANLLHQLGATRQDTASILLPSSVDNQTILWGSQATCITNPINHFLNVEHIIEIMNEVNTKVLFTLTPGIMPELTDKVHAIIEQVPSLTHIVCVNLFNSAQDNATAGFSGVEVLDFHQAMAAQPADKLLAAEPTGEQLAMYFHTGGTTGRPKVAQLRHSGIAFVSQVYAAFSVHHGRSTSLCALPLFHVFGAIACSLGMFIQGRTVVMMTTSGFRNPNVVKNWWYFVEQYQVVSIPVVPTIMAALMQQPSEQYDLSCLKHCGSGAAPLPEQLQTAFEQKYNCEVTDGYGMTEVSCVVTRFLPGFEVIHGSVGSPIPYTRVVAAEVDGNRLVRVCEPEEAGVILIKGPHVFAGYLNPDDDAKAWVDGEWFNTGDLGVIDRRGRISLTGRAKDLIIRGGHNIDPALIESVLLEHTAVAQAVAVGQPDGYAGEVPVAYVVLKNKQTAGSDELLEYCQAHISERAAIPKRIELIAQIPVTPVGKIFKPALRNMATEFAVDALLQQAGIQATLTAEFDSKKGQLLHVSEVSPESHQQIAELLTGLPVKVDFI